VLANGNAKALNWRFGYHGERARLQVVLQGPLSFGTCANVAQMLEFSMRERACHAALADLYC
jgi:hypothetical protein